MFDQDPTTTWHSGPNSKDIPRIITVTFKKAILYHALKLTARDMVEERQANYQNICVYLDDAKVGRVAN